jgi:hypothetical protein
VGWCGGGGGGGGGVAVQLETRGSGRGVWAKKVKPSCCSSVSGVPCEMAVGNDAEGWCDGVMVVVWPSGWKREARGGALGQKPETGPTRARFGARRWKQRW